MKFFQCSDRLFRPESILWLEGGGNYTRIHRQQRPPKLMAYTLKRFAHFVRVRRNVLVNPQHIRAFLAHHPTAAPVVTVYHCICPHADTAAPQLRWLPATDSSLPSRGVTSVVIDRPQHPGAPIIVHLLTDLPTETKTLFTNPLTTLAV